MLMGCCRSLSQKTPACVFIAIIPSPALAASSIAFSTSAACGCLKLYAVSTTSYTPLYCRAYDLGLVHVRGHPGKTGLPLSS